MELSRLIIDQQKYTKHTRYELCLNNIIVTEMK